MVESAREGKSSITSNPNDLKFSEALKSRESLEYKKLSLPDESSSKITRIKGALELSISPQSFCRGLKFRLFNNTERSYCPETIESKKERENNNKKTFINW